MKLDFGDIMQLIGAGMKIAELSKNKKGEDKKKIAVEIIKAGIPAATGVLTDTEAKDVELQEAISAAIDAQARLRNVFQKKTGRDIEF